jgi:hypothetical protein
MYNVLNLSTKEVVGYALPVTPDAKLANETLLNAMKIQKPNTSI